MQKLREYAPHLTVTRISPSPVAGIHEVEVKERGAMFYAAADGSHVITGDMYVLSGDGLQSITELRREERRRTPTIVTLDGERIAGYLSASEVAHRLGIPARVGLPHADAPQQTV